MLLMPAPRACLLLLIACLSRGAAAQPATAQKALCRDPQRSDRCELYLLVEMSAAARIQGTDIVEPPGCTPPQAEFCRTKLLDSYAAGDIGLMKNLDRQTSLGLSAQVGGSEGGVRMALRARYRRWFSDRLVLDAAAGPLMSQHAARDPSSSTEETYGATGDIGVGVPRIGLVFSGVDVAKQYGLTATSWHAGLRLESRGLIVGGTALLVGLAAHGAALKDGIF